MGGVTAELTPEDGARLVLCDYLRELGEPVGFSAFPGKWEPWLREIGEDQSRVAEVWRLYCPPSPHAAMVAALCRRTGYNCPRLVRVADRGVVEIREVPSGQRHWRHQPRNELAPYCRHTLHDWVLQNGECRVAVSEVCADGIVAVGPGVTDAEVIAVVGRRYDDTLDAIRFFDMSQTTWDPDSPFARAVRLYEERLAQQFGLNPADLGRPAAPSMDPPYRKAPAWELPDLPSKLVIERQDSVRERQLATLRRALVGKKR